MTDIVSDLRDWAAITDGVQGKAVLIMLSGQVFADAADEIERLRAKVADLTQRLHWANEEMLRRG